MPRTVWPWRTAIGVDLAGRRVRVAQCRRGVCGISGVTAAVEAVRPTTPEPGAPLTPDDAALVAGLIERAGLEGDRVVIAAPQSLILSSALELPPRSSGAPLDQIARLELARTHRVEPASFEMAMWDVPAPSRAAEGTHAMAVGLAPSGIEPFLAAMDAQGLEVVAIDVRALALARATRAQHAAMGITCIVDAHWHGLSVIMTMNGVVVVDRFVEAAAWGHVCLDGAARLGVSPDGAHDLALAAGPSKPGPIRAMTTSYLDGVVPEVVRSATYTSHRYAHARLSSIILTGDAAALPGLAERLAQGLDVPATLFAPEALGRGASFAGAIGLSMHGVRVAERRAA